MDQVELDLKVLKGESKELQTVDEAELNLKVLLVSDGVEQI